MHLPARYLLYCLAAWAMFSVAFCASLQNLHGMRVDLLMYRPSVWEIVIYAVCSIAFCAAFFAGLAWYRRSGAEVRIRFAIRDLFWLTALAALAAGWFLDHNRMVPRNPDLQIGRAVQAFHF